MRRAPRALRAHHHVRPRDFPGFPSFPCRLLEDFLFGARNYWQLHPNASHRYLPCHIWTASLSQQATCTNQGFRAKAYCPDCGQHVVDGRITAGSILSSSSWVFNNVTGVWLTLRDLWSGRHGWLGSIGRDAGHLPGAGPVPLVVVLLVSAARTPVPGRVPRRCTPRMGEVKLMVQFLSGCSCPWPPWSCSPVWLAEATHWEHPRWPSTPWGCSHRLHADHPSAGPAARSEDGAPPWFTGFPGAHFVLHPPLMAGLAGGNGCSMGCPHRHSSMALPLGCLPCWPPFRRPGRWRCEGGRPAGCSCTLPACRVRSPPTNCLTEKAAPKPSVTHRHRGRGSDRPPWPPTPPGRRARGR